MNKDKQNDRIQGVLFGARQTVFAGPSMHPKALLLQARTLAHKLAPSTIRSQLHAARMRQHQAVIETRYRIGSNATEVLKRFKNNR